MQNQLSNIKVFLGQTSLDFTVEQKRADSFIKAVESSKEEWFLLEHLSGKKTKIKLSSVVAYEVSQPQKITSLKNENLMPFTALAKFFSVHPIRIKRNCKKIVTEHSAGKRAHSRASLETAIEFRNYLVRSGEDAVPSEADIKSFFGVNKK